LNRFWVDTPFSAYLILEIDNGLIQKIDIDSKKDGSKSEGLKGLFEKVFENKDLSFFEYSLLAIDKTKKSYKLYEFLISTKTGDTISYSECADRVYGSKQYARAVAKMLNANKFAFVIPCHRVVAKNGIGGYAKGVELKKKILEWEGVDLRSFLDR